MQELAYSRLNIHDHVNFRSFEMATDQHKVQYLNTARLTTLGLAADRNYNGTGKNVTYDLLFMVTTFAAPQGLHDQNLGAYSDRFIFTTGGVCHLIPLCDVPTSNLNGGSPIPVTTGLLSISTEVIHLTTVSRKLGQTHFTNVSLRNGNFGLKLR